MGWSYINLVYGVRMTKEEFFKLMLEYYNIKFGDDDDVRIFDILNGDYNIANFDSDDDFVVWNCCSEEKNGCVLGFKVGSFDPYDFNKEVVSVEDGLIKHIDTEDKNKKMKKLLKKYDMEDAVCKTYFVPDDCNFCT